MNNLKMKAKAGVTLVELLVVILIVTILSVSLLPLLKPYIEKAKYAAEPIPVLANLQTKIELYQYEKGKLPCAENTTTANDYYTWYYESANEGYLPVNAKSLTTPYTQDHLQHLTDTDWQDLTGKNMKPSDFQYAVTRNESSGSYCYAVGVFGGRENSGLIAGTGYAVCKIVDLTTSNKLVAVWERYKPATTNALKFSVVAMPGGAIAPDVVPVPDGTSAWDGNIGSWTNMVNSMKSAGWQF